MVPSTPHGPSQRPSPGDVVADKYLLERVIGSGAMGVVYAARHLRTEKRCALKWLNSERNDLSSRARFQQEARAAGRVHHANVIAVYDVGEHQGAPFLVMEWLEGESLRERLRRGVLPVREAIDLIAQAARGVAAAHEANVIHRDLKPDNLFVTASARQGALLKVLDFGISKIEEDDSAMSLTRSGTMVGTPLYMAPERLYAEPSDGRADVYSLGVILYECLTCALPHPAENAADLGRRFAERAAIRLPSALRPEVPPTLDSIVLRALALSTDKRTQTAAGLAEQLETWSDLDKHAADRQTEGGRRPRGPAVETTVDAVPAATRSQLAAGSLPLAPPSGAPAAVADSAANARSQVRVRRGALLVLLLLAALAGLFAVLWELRSDTSRAAGEPRAAAAPTSTAAEKPVAPKPRSVGANGASHGANGAVDKTGPTAVIPAASATKDAAQSTPDAAVAPANLRLRRAQNAQSKVAPHKNAPATDPPRVPAKELGRSKAHFETDDFYDR